MTVSTILDSCRPRGGDPTGAVTEAGFAADPAQAIVDEGTAGLIDPVRFFADACPARDLKDLPENARSRLSGTGGSRCAMPHADEVTDRAMPLTGSR